MGYSKRDQVVLVVVLVMAAMMVEAEAAISCGTVSGTISSCLPYLVATAAAPSSGCCTGLNSLYTLANVSRPDRITVCGCINSAAATLGNNLNPANAANLAGKCAVNLGYDISASTNCNSIP